MQNYEATQRKTVRRLREFDSSKMEDVVRQRLQEVSKRSVRWMFEDHRRQGNETPHNAKL